MSTKLNVNLTGANVIQLRTAKQEHREPLKQQQEARRSNYGAYNQGRMCPPELIATIICSVIGKIICG